MWLIYVGHLVDEIKVAIGLIVVVILLSGLFLGFQRYEVDEWPSITKNHEERIKRWEDYKKKAVPLAIFLLLIGSLIPNSRTLYLMLGTKYSEGVFATKESKERLDKVLKIIDARLDRELKKNDK